MESFTRWPMIKDWWCDGFVMNSPLWGTLPRCFWKHSEPVSAHTRSEIWSQTWKSGWYDVKAKVNRIETKNVISKERKKKVTRMNSRMKFLHLYQDSEVRDGVKANLPNRWGSHPHPNWLLSRLPIWYFFLGTTCLINLVELSNFEWAVTKKERGKLGKLSPC